MPDKNREGGELITRFEDHLSGRVLKLGSMQSIALIDKAKVLQSGGVDVVQAAGNELGGVTMERVRNEAKKALDEGYTEYGPTNGLLELRQTIARHVKKRDGLDYDPENEIIITIGAAEAIFLTMQCLLKAGDEVLIPTPTYPFGLHVEYAGGIDVYAPLVGSRSEIVKEQVEKYVTTKTKLITLVTPHSPTGRVFTRKEIQAIADVAQEHEIFVATDLVNEALVFDGLTNYNIASFPGMKERTIILNSFSKSYAMGGWRVGYMIGNRTLVENAAKLHALINNSGGCTFAQRGAAEIYAGPQDEIENVRRQAEKTRDYAVRRLNEMPGITCHRPEGGAVAFPNISSYGLSSIEFSEWLLTNGRVATGPGVTYRADEHVRVNFTIPRLREALDRMEAAVKTLKSAKKVA